MIKDNVRKDYVVDELEKTGILMKDAYVKADVEVELLKFQSLIVSKVFEEAHAENLRINDVVDHIRDLAEKKGLQDKADYIDFCNMSTRLSRIIASEIAGNNGERHMAGSLQMITCNNRILRNVELSDGNFRAEIDALIITGRGIFIIETKNSTCDMIISSEGNYVSTTSENRILCNIGEKMNVKEFLVRKSIKNAGFDKRINLQKMVVFTNNYKKLVNNYPYICTCNCSHLPHIIDAFMAENIYTDQDIQEIADIIENARTEECYRIDFDFNEYRKLFASVLALTEIIDETPIDEANEGEADSSDEENDFLPNKSSVWRRRAKYCILPAVGVALLGSKQLKKIL